MNGNVLHVENVGKSFREYGSEWLRFAHWFGFRSPSIKENWVLRNISFVVREGEAVGIVGQNGAGKSTLLKIITGTLGATEGKVWVRGRISAILELGMGFNNELTARQNVIHSAGLLGFSRAEIDSFLPAVEDFAEIGHYFDEPMRTYSSGMHMRVAFSLATAVRPEVLIVDEALSVGDAYFVHKCFKRIRQFREEGTTLLIVSHDKSAVQSLCDRAVLLDKGRLLADGPPQEVMDLYNAIIAEKESEQTSVLQKKGLSGAVMTRSGTGEASINDVHLENMAGEIIEYVGVGDEIQLVVRVDISSDIDRLVIGYMIKDRLGQAVYGTNTHYSGHVLLEPNSGETYEFRASFPANLGVGTYSVSVALSSTETHLVNNYEWRDLALVFTVSNLSHEPFVGLTWMPPLVSVTEIGQQANSV